MGEHIFERSAREQNITVEEMRAIMGTEVWGMWLNECSQSPQLKSSGSISNFV